MVARTKTGPTLRVISVAQTGTLALNGDEASLAQ
jgi:hypothetical protein